MEDLVKYLNLIREKLERYQVSIPVQLVMDEICDIATNNWVETGNPELSREQFQKVMVRILNTGDTTLN